MSNRFSLGLLFVAVIVAACGPAGSTSPPAGPAQPSIVAYSPLFGGAAAVAAPLVIYDQQFLDTGHAGFLLTLTPGQSSPVEWALSSPTLALSQTQPFTFSIPGDPAPTAPPGGMFVSTINGAYGATTITATYGGGSRATISAVHFPSLSFGCYFRYAPAYAFDPDRSSLMRDRANWTSGDLYETAPAASLYVLDPCYQSALATGNAEIWHVPFGGTFVPASTLQDFAAVKASQWTNSGTTFAPAQGVLLLKTAEGRIVKALLPIGPLEVSDTAGAFSY